MLSSSGRRKNSPACWLSFVAVLFLSIPLSVRADSYEPDDTTATARRFVMDAPSQRHDFDKLADEDWVYFFSFGNLPYTIEATSVSAACDVTLAVYADTGASPTLLRFSDLRANGQYEQITFSSPTLPTGFYFARLRNYTPSQFGSHLSYLLRVYQPTGAGIPIETVDERTIGIRRATSPSPGRRAPAILTPGPGDRPNETYFRHRIEFPGYEITTTGTAIDVTIRSLSESGLWERGPGQNFPLNSRAGFVVKACQWTGPTSAPLAFTDPVDVTVEFGADSRFTDVVTFDNTAATTPQMNVVRDMLDGPGVNFQPVGGVQEINSALRTVTARGYSGLTGSSGSATYGAVAVPSAAARHWELYP